MAGKKKASAPDAAELKGICGDSGIRGHQAVTCAEPCFACGGDHKYFECTHDQLHHEAKRMASRNRVHWKGYGAKETGQKKTTGMKESGAGKYWVRQPYDPEYTSERERSPKRKFLDKVQHPSDRCKIALRSLWDQTEEMAMASLLDGGFLTGVCLDKNGQEINCKGTLTVHYHCNPTGQVNRRLRCVGVPHKHTHIKCTGWTGLPLKGTTSWRRQTCVAFCSASGRAKALR